MLIQSRRYTSGFPFAGGHRRLDEVGGMLALGIILACWTFLLEVLVCGMLVCWVLV